jgi:hypothetical protein
MSVFRLSVPQLQRLIRARAEDSAQIAFTHHVLLRMKQRHIVRMEVMEVLRKGLLHRQPEPNSLRGSLECRMQRFMAGRELAVVVALNDADPTLVVVTALVVED